MEGLELQSWSIWINVGAAVVKFGNSPRFLSSLLWIYDILRLRDAGLMMHSGKHWRLPATAPESLPLIARISTRRQVYFLCSNGAAAFFFYVFLHPASVLQSDDRSVIPEAGTLPLYKNTRGSEHSFE